MKRIMALIALAGMMFVGCAKDKNVGGSSDDSMRSSSSSESNPSKSWDTSTNGSVLYFTNSDSSKPQQQ